MTWNMGRLWGFVGNTAYYSGGPDTLVGNGNTAWPPLNSFPFVGKIIKMRPVLVENGGMLVYTTSGIQIILGTGTQSNPFYDSLYCDKINLAGYNAEDILGSQLFLMEANGQVSSITIQYPFNPQSGYTEIGFPIGDQFLKVTTGGISSALYNPATAFLSWNKANTKDMGMYVADGAVGWFRLSMVNPPESGLLWSPRAAIARAHNHNSGEKNVEPEANHSEVFYSLFPVLSLPVPCFPPYPHPPHPVEIYFRPLQFL